MILLAYTIRQSGVATPRPYRSNVQKWHRRDCAERVDVDLPNLAIDEIIEFSLRHVRFDLLVDSNHGAKGNTDPDDDCERVAWSAWPFRSAVLNVVDSPQWKHAIAASCHLTVRLSLRSKKVDDPKAYRAPA